MIKLLAYTPLSGKAESIKEKPLPAMKKISYDDAAEILTDFILECDVDELASVFGNTFGYDVMVDEETEQLECTPNGVCGFILGGGQNVTHGDNRN